MRTLLIKEGPGADGRPGNLNGDDIITPSPPGRLISRVLNVLGIPRWNRENLLIRFPATKY